MTTANPGGALEAAISPGRRLAVAALLAWLWVSLLPVEAAGLHIMTGRGEQSAYAVQKHRMVVGDDDRKRHRAPFSGTHISMLAPVLPLVTVIVPPMPMMRSWSERGRPA